MTLDHSLQTEKANLLDKPSWLIFMAVVYLTSMLTMTAYAQTAGRQVLAGHVSQAVASSQVLHELPRATQLNLAFGLPLRNQEKLNALLSDLSDPSSPNYRHYLTPEQFAAEFGPTEADYQALIHFVQQNGLTVTAIHANRVLLDVSGAVPDIERTLHVKMMKYKNPTRGEFIATDREPSVDLDVNILHIGGLDNYVLPMPMNLKTTPMTAEKPYVTGSGPGGYFIGSDFRAAYAPGVTLTGNGQAVGLVEFDGFYPGDVQRNFAHAGLQPVPTRTVLLDGFKGTPGGANIEVILDIMMASYMAPGLSNVIVYEGFFPDDILNRMATDDQARQLSSSWGFGIDATTEQIYEEFIAQGQSLLQASGDSGAYRYGVMPPSDNPNLTVVGGTSLTTSGAGGPWSAETAWSGSGGGISSVYPIPSYQQGFSMAASGGSTTMRNIPDVAMVAAVQIYLIYNNGEPVAVGGTSAAAPLWAGFVALANQQAAASSNPPVGFLNPLLYAIGNSGNYSEDLSDIRLGSNGYPAVAGFDLATGWGSPAGQNLINDLSDASTGSFTISSAVSALTLFQANTVSTTITVAAANGFAGAVGFGVTGLPSGVTARFSSLGGGATSLTLTSTINAAPGTYTLGVIGSSGDASSATNIVLTVPAQAFSLSASASSLTLLVGGSSASSIIGVAGQNGFISKVNLAASGLPVGVSLSLSSSSTSTTSTLCFRPSTTAVPGTYTVTVTGTSGNLSSSTSIALTIPVPSFDLSSSASNLTLLVGGSSEASIISVANPVGLVNKVSLGVSGVPAGVTAYFSSSSTITISTLSFRASTTAVPGAYNVTVTGTSGIATNSTTFELTIPVPSFNLSSSNSSLTLLVGGSSQASTIGVVNPVGLAVNVSLTASQLPVGVTASFSPSSTSTTSTVSFKPAVTAAPGTYNVTVTGTSGVATNTTTIALTIPLPSFGLSPSASALTLLVGGSSQSSTISVVNPVGLANKVTLGVSGVPTGVTTSFSSSSTSTTSTLSFRAGTTAVPGTYTVTVTGTSGTATSTTTVALTIPVPSFSLSSSAGSLALVASGASASSTVSVSKINGFNSSVALTVTGLPTGVTATFSSASTSTTSTLALKRGTTAVPGGYTVTVTGTCGALTSNATVGLTIE